MSRSHVVPLILAAACWGTGAVATKHAVASIDPVPLLVIQLAVSSSLMSVLALRLPGERPSGKTALLGVLNPGFAYLLNLVGLSLITAGLSVVLWALEPVFIVVLAGLFVREPFRARTTLAMAVAVAGAAASGSGQLSGGGWLGISLTVAAVACCAVYAVAVREWADGASTVRTVASQQRAALYFALLVAGWMASRGSDVIPRGVPSAAWASAALSGALYYGLAFWAFLTGLRRTTASIAGQFVNLVPVFGIVAGVIALGEDVTPMQAVGSAAVLGAVGYIIAQDGGVGSDG